MVFSLFKPGLSTPNWQNDIQKLNYKNTLLITRYIDISEPLYHFRVTDMDIFLVSISLVWSPCF